MNSLTIEAKSMDSARAIEAALRGFDRELLAEGDRYRVHVRLPVGNQEIIALLNMLEQYVRDRGDGPARIEYDGRSYTLEASSHRD